VMNGGRAGMSSSAVAHKRLAPAKTGATAAQYSGKFSRCQRNLRRGGGSL